jgi:curved DNA-binding protein
VEFKDYYQTMGVPRDATEVQIKQAYRKLARKYHPDVSKEKDAEARFKEVGEAYEVLKDPEKRAAYDRLGQEHQRGEQFRPPPGWNAGFEFSGPGQSADYSEFFEALFGAAQSRRRATASDRGEDHHAKVLLDLEASLHGGSRTLSLQLPHLNEAGRLTMRERTLNVQIPKGILAGQQIRLPGQGEQAAGAAPGDLFIEVEFKPHALYEVSGRDLLLHMPLCPWEAALGATVTTPTPGGKVELKIPEGSHAGSKLRLKGRGIPASPPGDLYVTVQIALPPAQDEKSRQAYAAMAAAMPFNPRVHLGG